MRILNVFLFDNKEKNDTRHQCYCYLKWAHDYFVDIDTVLPREDFLLHARFELTTLVVLGTDSPGN
jgi:hypothetical protein